MEKSKTDSHFYVLRLKGEDIYGIWTAEGEYIFTYEGPYFWFRKAYTVKVKAELTGERSILLYESTEVDKYGCKGIWFFQKMKSF